MELVINKKKNLVIVAKSLLSCQKSSVLPADAIPRRIRICCRKKICVLKYLPDTAGGGDVKSLSIVYKFPIDLLLVSLSVVYVD